MIKVELKCVFGGKNPKDIITLDEKVAQVLISEGNAVEVTAETEIDVKKLNNDNKKLQATIAMLEQKLVDANSAIEILKTKKTNSKTKGKA